MVFNVSEIWKEHIHIGINCYIVLIKKGIHIPYNEYSIYISLIEIASLLQVQLITKISCLFNKIVCVLTYQVYIAAMLLILFLYIWAGIYENLP